MEQISQFLKTNKEKIIRVMFIFLLCLASFGFGYLSNREYNHAPIIIEKNSK